MSIRHSARVWVILAIVLCMESGLATNSAADDLNWQSVNAIQEYLPAQNKVTTQPNQSMPCNINDIDRVDSNLTLPKLSKFGELDFDEYVTGFAWSPNGQRFATSENFDRVIKIWGFPALKLASVIDKEQPGSIENANLLFTRDGRQLITSSPISIASSSGDAFSIIDVQSGQIVRNVAGYEIPPHYPLADIPRDFHLSYDGRYLFSAFNGDNWNEYVFDTTSWKLVSKIAGDEVAMTDGPGPEQISMVHFISLSDGFSGDPSQYRSKFLIWDQKNHKPVFLSNFLRQSEFPVESMTYDADACAFIFGFFSSKSGEGIKIWYPATGFLYSLPFGTPVTQLSISASHNIFAFIDGHDQVALIFFDQKKHRAFSKLVLPDDLKDPFKISFSEDGTMMAVASGKHIIFYSLQKQ